MSNYVVFRLNPAREWEFEQYCDTWAECLKVLEGEFGAIYSDHYPPDSNLRIVARDGQRLYNRAVVSYDADDDTYEYHDVAGCFQNYELLDLQRETKSYANEEDYGSYLRDDDEPDIFATGSAA